MFSVAPSLIRFWESEFDIIKPKKNRKGNRQFTREDIDNVRTIYHPGKGERFLHRRAPKEMLRNDTEAVRDKMEMIESLKRVREVPAPAARETALTEHPKSCSRCLIGFFIL